jgi:hypothetical protein
MPLPANYRGVLDAKDVVPMTTEQSEALLKLGLLEIRFPGPAATYALSKMHDDMIRSVEHYRLLHKRMEAHQVRATLATQLMVCFLFDNPADCVLWCFTLATMFKEHRWRPVTLENLVNAFPMGFPSPNEFEEAWRAQKMTKAERTTLNDNWLDVAASWPLPPVEVPT